jgi:4-hydroxybenzoate polyprenyltransferase/predicted HAD superfamily phosphohydrolase YqeG
MKKFRELNNHDIETYFKDKKVFLDIDGTFAFDKSHHVDPKDLEKLEEVKKVADVHIVSNGTQERTKELGNVLNIKMIVSNHQKPSPKVLQGYDFGELNRNNSIVVGDKFLTDGIFGLRLGIPFFHVKSLQSPNESLYNRTLYFVDDVIGNAFEFVKIVRLKQWVKNFLVFAPVFFAGSFFDLGILSKAVVAFFAFSFSASIVYVFNDAVDLESDRLHPKKKFRPLATGNLEKTYLYIFSLVCAYLLGLCLYVVPEIIYPVLLYIILNLAYSFKLKNVPVYDVILVATMYLMRAVVGGIATAIYISPWLIICIFFAALFMILGKRYGEIENPTRKVLKYYTKTSLSSLLNASATLTVASYTIYTIIGSKHQYSVYSVILVTAMFFIILNDIYTGHKKIESPESYLLSNRKIVFLIFVWFALEAILIYPHL